MANSPASSDETVSRDFEMFFRENYLSLWRYVARRVPQAKVDDVVSASFMVAWEKYSTVDNPSLPWLIRIASFEVANTRRKRSREHLRAFSAVLEEFAAPDGDDFDGAGVRSAIATLSESDQEILRLVLWDELPRDDIAQVLGLSVNAVNVRYHRALQKFERSIVVPHHVYPVKEDPNAK
ncbi:MAG: sigma-70 family RNA polymerase sigma factor [Acidobacteriota bacterium]|nr:sigma-70 family RNA polymerase sigma factor [Acidobacteriota bacterium]